MIEYTPKLEKLKEYLDHLSVAEKECLHDLSYPFIPNFDPLFDTMYEDYTRQGIRKNYPKFNFAI